MLKSCVDVALLHADSLRSSFTISINDSSSEMRSFYTDLVVLLTKMSSLSLLLTLVNITVQTDIILQDNCSGKLTHHVSNGIVYKTVNFFVIFICSIYLFRYLDDLTTITLSLYVIDNAAITAPFSSKLIHLSYTQPQVSSSDFNDNYNCIVSIFSLYIHIFTDIYIIYLQIIMMSYSTHFYDLVQFFIYNW